MAEEQKQKNGLGSRAKKFVGSRTAGTKLGRKAILGVLGEDGEILFNSIKDSAKLFYGEKQGKKLKEDMVKMILKINLMVSEKRLTPDNTSSGQDCLHRLMFQAQRDFDGSGHHVEPQNLHKRLEEVSRVWGEIVKTKMQDKNLDKLQEVLGMLSKIKYLDALFNGDDYTQLRETISSSLSRLMHQFGITDPNEQSNCQMSSCLNPVVRSRGLFRSAGFCAMHHADHFHGMCDKPRLQDFLTLERAASLFTQFLEEEADLAPFHFLKAVSDFKSISSQNIRLRSVNAIRRKFLENGAPMKVEVGKKALRELIEKIERIDEENPRISTGLFSDAEQSVREVLGKLFDSKFIKSQYFERFVASYRLSEVDMKVAQKQRLGM